MRDTSSPPGAKVLSPLELPDSRQTLPPNGKLRCRKRIRTFPGRRSQGKEVSSLQAGQDLNFVELINVRGDLKAGWERDGLFEVLGVKKISR